MAENFNARIKNKRDTSANWTTNDPVILNGEIILVDTATGELRAKIGDGTKRYTELPFTDEAIKTLLNNKADADHTHSDEAIDAQYMPLTVMMEDGSFNSYLPTEMGSIKKYKIINSVDNAPVAAELIAVNNSGTETYAQIIRMYKPSTYNPDTEPNYAYKEWQRVISDVTGERVYGAWNQTFPIEIPETIEVDTELSTTSENPVQNKIITNALNNHIANKNEPHVQRVSVGAMTTLSDIIDGTYTGFDGDEFITSDDIKKFYLTNVGGTHDGVELIVAGSYIDGGCIQVLKVYVSGNVEVSPQICKQYYRTKQMGSWSDWKLVEHLDEELDTASTNAVQNKVVATKINDVETALERIKYYGSADIVPSDESYFTVNETGETITGLTDTGKTQTELVIPYEINGVEITTFYSGVGYDEPQSILAGSSVTKVVVPNSVTTFGRGAFYKCSLLTSINIPNSVTSIEKYAFQYCTSLVSINIPNSVTSIGENAFGNCASLASINIPNSVTSIEKYAFQYCYALTSIEIGNSVTSIGVWTFSDCTNLTIYCEQGSYAETYAKNNNIPVVYTAVNDIGSGVEIVDNLTTSDSTKALSANQGRVLKSQIDGKAHTSHASAATTYGVGTSTDYGHLKVADNLTTTTSGTALSANQGKVLNDFITKIENNTTLIKNNDGGFAAGTGAVTTNGGAVGEKAHSVNGGAVGYKAVASRDGGVVGRFAEASSGGAVGDNAKSGSGFAGGMNSKAVGGGAVGYNTRTSEGFAGGSNAICATEDYSTNIDAIQLGRGTNSTEKTLQVYDYQLMDASGNIPAERLANVPQIIVEDNLTSTSSANALSAAQGKVLKAEIDELVTSIEEKANSDLSNLSDASTALANLGLTATATEINYTDGVTSNIQTQLNNKASSSHIQPASTITSGTFSSTSIKAATGTDYTTARIRNIQASTTDLTAGISALSNGDIYFVYE